MRHTTRPLAALSILAAATLLVACERKTTTVNDAPAGSTSTTTSTTIVAPTPAASDAMAATASAIGTAASGAMSSAATAMSAAASATERAADKAGDALGDAAITGKVKSALIADPDIKALRIDVDTKDGVVTLNGTADSSAHSDQAATVARGVDGVKSVENRLTIKP